MALINENIDKLDEEINDIQRTSSEFLGVMIEEATAFFNNDSNYQIFVSGTQTGKELDEKLKQLINIAKNLNENEVQNIIKITTQFTQFQRNLNQGGN